MKITDNFKRIEFDCHDGTPYPEEWIESRLKPLCQALEAIRAYAGNLPITINSGYRTAKHNAKVGGAKNSLHVLGMAADFHIKGLHSRMVYKLIEKGIKEGKIPEGGLGSYQTWVHYDIRGNKSRWVI